MNKNINNAAIHWKKCFKRSKSILKQIKAEIKVIGEQTVNTYSCLVENYHMDASALLSHVILQHLQETIQHTFYSLSIIA